MKITAIAGMIILILCIIGYVLNVVKFVGCDFASPYKCEAVRVIGIVVPPVGIVTGWIDFGK